MHCWTMWWRASPRTPSRVTPCRPSQPSCPSTPTRSPSTCTMRSTRVATPRCKRYLSICAAMRCVDLRSTQRLLFWGLAGGLSQACGLGLDTDTMCGLAGLRWDGQLQPHGPSRKALFLLSQVRRGGWTDQSHAGAGDGGGAESAAGRSAHLGLRWPLRAVRGVRLHPRAVQP